MSIYYKTDDFYVLKCMSFEQVYFEFQSQNWRSTEGEPRSLEGLDPLEFSRKYLPFLSLWQNLTIPCIPHDGLPLRSVPFSTYIRHSKYKR